MAHKYAVIVIGLLIAVRLGLRFLNPQQGDAGHRSWQTKAASTVHRALYLSVLGQAATGFVSSYLWKGVVPFHQMLWNLTLTLVNLHVLAVAIHLVRRDGVVGKMVPRRAER